MSTNHSVLVTDDDEDLRLLCQMHLELAGFKVDHAANGEEALQVAREKRPDLILLDLMMPVMDGWDCLSELKADAALSGIPVFIITAKTQKPDQDRAFSLGAEAFITKPFEGPTLIGCVRSRLQVS